MNIELSEEILASLDPRERRFCCPNCSSDRFGTEDATAAPESWIGRCHGFGGRCVFTWPRSDDHKYFHPNTTALTGKVQQLYALLAEARSHGLVRGHAMRARIDAALGPYPETEEIAGVVPG